MTPTSMGHFEPEKRKQLMATVSDDDFASAWRPALVDGKELCHETPSCAPGTEAKWGARVGSNPLTAASQRLARGGRLHTGLRQKPSQCKKLWASRFPPAQLLNGIFGPRSTTHDTYFHDGIPRARQGPEASPKATTILRFATRTPRSLWLLTLSRRQNQQ